MRDIGPLSRRLNLMSKDFRNDENYKEVRQLQKRILNHFVEIDPTLVSSGSSAQKNLNDEFLLALSGQVPIDKLLKRLAAVRDVKLWNQVEQAEFQGKAGQQHQQALNNSPIIGGAAPSEKMQGTSNEDGVIDQMNYQ